MDEAFVPLSAMVGALLAGRGEIVDHDAGVRSVVTAYEIDTPIELDVSLIDGAVAIGTVPPLYLVDTSMRPSFHAIRFRAELDEAG